MAMAGVDAAATFWMTPTWISALVCSIMVLISIVAERCIHRLGKTFKRRNQKALYGAIFKVKEELMLLGFVSLLLTVCQGFIHKICIPPSWIFHMLPCQTYIPPTKEHFVPVARRLLSNGGAGPEFCQDKGKVPLMSLEAIHQLHIFIFVLAITHVVFCTLTMILGGAKIRQWKLWEDAIQKDMAGIGPKKVTPVQNFQFIREHFKGVRKHSSALSWLHSFYKQFYGSVNNTDYNTLRLGFITTHCRGNLNFDFHKYMLRVLESDFKKVVGISWYQWVFVMIFLLLNVNGWYTYLWISFLSLIILLAIGTKLEHVIAQFAQDVAEKHSSVEGDLIIKPSDEHFWFRRPRIVLFFIHFILFQNAFQIAFFFWALTTHGFRCSIMRPISFTVLRLLIGLIIQLLCSYSTLPLYAVVTQMGSFYRKEIFTEHVQQGVLGWAQNAKMKGFKKSNEMAELTSSTGTSATNEMMKQPVPEGNDACEIIEMAELTSSTGISATNEMMKQPVPEGNNDACEITECSE